MPDRNEAPSNLVPAPIHTELPPAALRWYVDPQVFDFPSTAFVAPLEGIIGQSRALGSLHLGAQISSPGYNIFVSGMSGTGRLTTIKSILEKIIPTDRVPHDYAYVNNFEEPSCPFLLTFPRGKALHFQKAMQEGVAYLRHQIPKMFEDEQFRAGRSAIINDFQGRERGILDEFEAEIKPKGFALGQRKVGEMVQPEILPTIGEESYPIEALPKLVEEKKITEEDAKRIEEEYNELRKNLYDVARQGMRLSREFQKTMDEYEHKSARLIVEASIDDIRTKFPFESVREYLDMVHDAILDDLEPFKNASHNEETAVEATNNPFLVYQVNVILDNSRTDGTPVIIETTPTFISLFGTLERTIDPKGFWTSDFTRIRGGSLLRADGGYLIINAGDALSEPGVWKSLKRVLLYRQLEIQSIESFFQTSSPPATAMKPEPIGLNVKVIMIGQSQLYQALYSLDEDFRKIFKINAEFDYEIQRSEQTLKDYAKFIRRMSDEEHLLHFDRDATASVIEYAVEQAGKVDKISLRFSDIADLLRESSYWAEQDHAEVVGRYHVEKAISMMVERNSMWKDKTLEHVLDGSLLIDTSGMRIGQINGLAVYSVGQISFGKPTRITATVAVGAQGITNIDREAHLSGSIYNKGSMILFGFFRSRFAQKRPLTLAASIVFEQSYGGVDGDSASSTEVYALMSALSRVPIHQQFAVTGSVNQWGEIQPIGGVKQKIEGFFEICRTRGLTGGQGVLIPIQNVGDLMLSHDVVEAVQEKRFHIYAVRTIDQGIEILTGVAAGTRGDDGQFPPGTVNRLVEDRLIALGEAMRNQGSLQGDGMPAMIRTAGQPLPQDVIPTSDPNGAGVPPPAEPGSDKGDNALRNY